MGVQNIESGSVTVLGEAAGSPRNRRRVGYQTQMPSVYLDITVPEKLLYFAKPVGSASEVADQVLEKLWQGIRRRAADGATVVVSSHVMDEAARCDELLLLRGGRLLATGTPKDITALADTDNLDSAFLSLARRQQVSP